MDILSSVYAIFFPFMQNLWTVNQYHMAYYGAVSAVERAELGLRYRSPWFVWSGWFFGTTGYGPLSDFTPDFFSDNHQWFWWTIDSRTTSIPRRGMGNIDSMLSDSGSDSKDYNQLWYINLETFLLSYDATTSGEMYYTGDKNLSYFSGTIITWTFRLPPKVFSGFWWWSSALLCDNLATTSDCDPDSDGIYNDIALSWSLEWVYVKENGFKIFPTIAVFEYSGMQIDTDKDNTIREFFINETGVLSFENFTPVVNGAHLDKHNVVGADASFIEWKKFSNILSDTNNFSDLSLSFGAVNFFRTRIGTLYPYLEYQFTFPQAIADRFYTIEGHGRVGEYDVQIDIKKPTVQWTVGGDFTVIF